MLRYGMILTAGVKMGSIQQNDNVIDEVKLRVGRKDLHTHTHAHTHDAKQ